ncbi:hypothetical protein QJU23_10080 [Pasteurella atlantica]|uniref:Uncharacterized protein n=2 Tax=Pasteurellaceae TaxID=712 RepID=A0ACC6HPM5_9PAST|nr:hypothetical protein [Pasteurella atlantica]MDP8052758.1 hypothetical protein [Pasteurella atlantica]MDP8106055.1 hypothetical protein [Pasteurella atlantica]MDP8149438.1 hypothetical protein [Pasteurella atlantica]
MMNKEIINLFENIDDDSSSDELSLISLKLRNYINILDKNNITYDKTAEGIRIDFNSQSFYLYKNKKDCIKFCTKFDKDILIIGNQLCYYVNDKKIEPFFENLIFFEKIKLILLNNDIFAFDDKLKKEFILLSASKGKFHIGYKNKNSEFFNKDHNLKKLTKQIEEKFTHNEYISFFKDNVISSLENINDIGNRFFTLLEKLNNVVEKSNREFELFKSQFSFEKFNSDLQKEKDSYIKNIQNNLSDFLSKINAFPIQFGVYIYLIIRFKDNPIPLFAILFFIVCWGVFSFKTINIIKSITNLNEQKIKNTINEIKEETKMTDNDLQLDDINKNISNINRVIKWHQIFLLVSSIVFIIICIFLLNQNLNIIDLGDSFFEWVRSYLCNHIDKK